MGFPWPTTPQDDDGDDVDDANANSVKRSLAIDHFQMSRILFYKRTSGGNRLKVKVKLYSLGNGSYLLANPGHKTMGCEV